MELKKGIQVEVCSNEDGYGGAWFEGLILSVTADGRRCKIRYDKFVTDDGKPLEEEVCLQTEVRPIPRRIQWPLHCSVGDAVEAYDTDCWWRGMIVKLVTGAEEELWVVYFRDTRTVKEYPRSDLRPAQEWFRGHWIRPPQENSTIIEKVIRSFGLENSEETSLKSRGESDGEKKRRAVHSKEASLKSGGESDGEKKRRAVPSKEASLKSGGESDGEKKRRAVESKEASLGGGASGKRKKLKRTVNTTVSRRQASEEDTYGLESGPSSVFSFKFSKKSPGRRAAEAVKRNGTEADMDNEK